MRRHALPETNTEPLRPQADAELTKKKIDRYQLCELIGCGGMGAVYRAVDTKLGRTVALKTATGKRNGARLTDRVRQRFLREAMALSKVEHRNVVQVLDFGFADDGTPFLVMEHLRGRDLGQLLAETRKPLAVTEVVDMMLGVCAALRACHRVGIIHRDLKPGNIFLAATDTGREVKVLDFGVSKAPTADDLTREGQILGTPQYLAPEQIDGKVGPASDQYALGVLLYVCLTLRLPYEAVEDRALLRALETGQFAAPRMLRKDLPEELEAIVLRAMHVTPSERFESVYALGQRLWELASPRAHEEWRSYYRPQLSAGSAPASPMLTKTQILEPSHDGEPEGHGGQPSTLTAWVQPSVRLGDVLDPRATPQDSAELEISRGPRLRIGAALLLLAVGGWLLARHHLPRRPTPRAPTRTAPPPRPASPRQPTPKVPATPPVRRASEPPPRPAPEAPVTATPPADVPPPGATAPPPAARPARPRRRKRPPEAPFSSALPNIDRSGIGIPAD
jgi:eukaryotic-like serine/threonine-protein kinase